MAASLGSTSIASRPTLRIASSCRGFEVATRINAAPAQTERTRSHSIASSGMISTPEAPSRWAASHASERIGSGAVALETWWDVTGAASSDAKTKCVSSRGRFRGPTPSSPRIQPLVSNQVEGKTAHRVAGNTVSESQPTAAGCSVVSLNVEVPLHFFLGSSFLGSSFLTSAGLGCSFLGSSFLTSADLAAGAGPLALRTSSMCLFSMLAR